jgi:twitching motility protein PilI
MDSTSDLPIVDATKVGGWQPKANRLGDLQTFQTRIAEKIANAQATKILSQSLLAVQVGAYGVHIPLSDMSTLLAMPDISPVPLVKQWLKGLTVVRAEVVTVLDLAYCLHVYIATHLPGLAIDSSAGEPLSSELGLSSQAKLLIINPLLQNQLAVLVDKVYGIVVADELIPHTYNCADNEVVIKRVSIDASGLVFVELSLDELLKSATFLRLNY